MSEVSSWSPTDASNNLTPPDGWPEGMQPSGVNDVGRMMMGAIKRMYDVVAGQIANCMPLGGGTFTGPVTAPGLTSTGNITAAGNISANVDIYGRQLIMTGNITTPLDISARNITASGGVTSPNLVSSGGITASGNIQGAYIHSTGNLDAAGAIGATNITASNQVNADALYVAHDANIEDLTLRGGLYAMGNIQVDNVLTASGAVNTALYELGGVTFSYRVSDGAGNGSVICSGDGSPSIVLYGANGSYYRCGNAHSFTDLAASVNIVRFQVTDGVCQNASGSWSTLSDASLKENVVPYTAGLAEIMQLNPQSFSYIPGRTKFATEGQTYYGLVAQEVEPVLPEMVGTEDENGMALLQPTHLVYVLTNAVKTLAAQNAALEARLTALETGG
jgi:hypothetical protein